MVAVVSLHYIVRTGEGNFTLLDLGIAREVVVNVQTRSYIMCNFDLLVSSILRDILLSLNHCASGSISFL